MKDVIKIWKEKNKILEGIRNNIFKKADVEHIAAERMEICSTCPHLDTEGSKCMVPGTGPCCGLCGCSDPPEVFHISVHKPGRKSDTHFYR